MKENICKLTMNLLENLSINKELFYRTNVEENLYFSELYVYL